MNVITLEKIVDLFEPGGVFTNYPGPVLLFDSNSEIVSANPQAYKIVHSVQEGNAVAVRALISAAMTGKEKSQTLRISDDDTGISTDLVAIPVKGTDRILVMGRDVSLDQNLRTALIDSRQRYKDLVEISSDFAWETGDNGNFVFVSSGGALGYEPDEMVSYHYSRFVAGENVEELELPFNTRRKVDGIEFMFRRNNGEFAELSASGAPIYDQDGTWKGARGICRDITAERARDAALARALHRERLITYIVRTMNDEVDPGKILVAAAKATCQALSADECRILRFDKNSGPKVAASFGEGAPDALMSTMVEHINNGTMAATRVSDTGHGICEAISYHQSLSGGLLLWRPEQSGEWTEDEEALLDEVCGQLGIALEQVAAHEKMHIMSTTDPLTGLFNRRSFVEFLEGRLENRPENRRPGVLAYVDLDNFKAVNDTFGHQAGDDVLTGLRDLLQEDAEDNDVISRLGGDEFAIWLEDTAVDAAPARAERILALATSLRKVASHPDKPLGLSVGMAVVESGGVEDVDQLIGRADEVMYEVKHGGKGSYRMSLPPNSETSSDDNSGED